MTIRSLNARLARPSASVALQSEKHTFLDQAVLPVLLTVQYTSGSADNVSLYSLSTVFSLRTLGWPSLKSAKNISKFF